MGKKAILTAGCEHADEAIDLETLNRPTFHAFVDVTLSAGMVASIDASAAGTAVSSAALPITATVAGNPSGDVQLVTSLSTAIAPMITSFGQGGVVLTTCGQITMNGFAVADGSVVNQQMSVATVHSDLDGPVFITAVLPIEMQVDGHIEPPRVNGDLVSEFGTFYIGVSAAATYVPASKAIAYAVPSVAVAAQ